MAEAGRKTSYRGRWKKWLLIYLAVAAVVYAIVYFVFLHGSAYGGGGSGAGGRYGLVVLPMLLQTRVRDWFAHRSGHAR